MAELSKDEYQSPRITGEILDCSMPMTFDQYNNCGFNCLYCFSTFQRGIGPSKEDYWKKKKIKAINIDSFKKMFDKNYNGQFAYIIKNKKPLQWGGLSDPFCPLEEELGIGLEILNFLSEKKYPVSFSSKSDLLLRNKKYWNAFMKNKENYHYKCSIITLDENISKILEAGTPSPQRRLEVLKALSKAGVETTLRLRPIIIGISNLTYLELIKKAAEAGVKSVSAEFFCLELRANAQTLEKYKHISKLCGFDILEYYKKLSKGAGYLRLNYKVKEKYIKEIKDACDQYGLRLHISDAHHKELSSTGSCCGLPDNHPTLSNYQKSQFTNAIIIARKNGTVSFDEISNEFDWLKSFKWGKTKGYNTGSNHIRLKKQDMTMYDYMRNAWNNPNSAHSPYRYFDGALIPLKVDKNNNLIYKYNGAWREGKEEIKEEMSCNPNSCSSCSGCQIGSQDKDSYSFCIPSRGRANKVDTLKLIKKTNRPIYIFVDTQKEFDDYKKHNPGIEIVLTNKKGIQNVRNFILDYFNPGEKIVTMCDDVKGVFKAKDKKFIELTPKELDKFILEGFNECEKYGTKLWGVYPIKNTFYMSDKIGKTNFIIGTFSGIIVSDIRHDKELILKEDYDFTIKHILKFKKVLRFNNYCVQAKHYTNKGGAVDYRNDDSERISINRLIELYPEYVKENPKRKNEILLKFKKKDFG